MPQGTYFPFDSSQFYLIFFLDTSSTHPSVSEPHSDSETEVIHDCPCAPLLPTNLVEKKDMYYAVIVGRHPGVFHGPYVPKPPHYLPFY